MSGRSDLATLRAIGENIRAKRRVKYLSQRALGAMIGLHASTISNLENGKAGIDTVETYLPDIAQALWVTVDKLREER